MQIARALDIRDQCVRVERADVDVPDPEIEALTLFTLPDAWIEPDPERFSASERSLIPYTRIVAEPVVLTASSEGPVMTIFTGRANDSTSLSSTVSTPFLTAVTTCGKTSAGADTVIEVYGLIEKAPSTAPINRTPENASVCRLCVVSAPALLWAIATQAATLQITAAAHRTIDTRILHPHPSYRFTDVSTRSIFSPRTAWIHPCRRQKQCRM